MKKGKVYGVGVGPGDPELLTLKALRLLRAAPVVAYPAPEGGESLARRIVAGFLDPAQKEIAIEVPMVPDRDAPRAAYRRALPALAAELDAGRDVVILCLGDPFLYGSFMYLFALLAEDYRVEIVPGISSLTACAAVSRMPLAGSNDVLSILPAPMAEAELEACIAVCDAAAIIKLGRHFAKVRGLLDRLGLISRARYVARATLPGEQVLPLSEIDANAEVPYFAMILLHKRGAAWMDIRGASFETALKGASSG